jgi:hypothetical protein
MDRDLSAALAAAARTVGRSASVEDTLEAIVQTARSSLPGFDHVGVSTIERDGTVVTRAQTGDLVRQLDDLQYELREGPCVDSLQDALVVEAPDIRHDQRWPRYVPEAVALGLKSQLALKLYLDEDGTLGGLNIYSTTTTGIDPEAVAAADLFATHAAVALGKVRELSQLHEAMRSRELIGKAIGLMMAKYDLDEQSGFNFLVRISSHSNEKLRDVAAAMVEHHVGEMRRASDIADT